MGWMGPGDHEGWVVPLFADGAQGAGSSSSAGILVDRRPGDGPLNGDRVRLVYPDGSSAEGVWQDDALLTEDERVLTHTRGQVEREVLERVEDWRPDTAVVGWAAGCECGWRGRPWTRVNSAIGAGSAGTSTPIDGTRFDPRNRLIFQPGPYADLDSDAERAVIDEWRAHIAPLTVLEDLQDAAAAHADSARALDTAVRAARATGASWADIGRATGMTKQSAHTRWRDLDQVATPMAQSRTGSWWDVAVRWDGETHTDPRPFPLFTEAQTWCADKVTELFADGDADERAAAAALVDRIHACTGESASYHLVDAVLAVDVDLIATSTPAVHNTEETR